MGGSSRSALSASALPVCGCDCDRNGGPCDELLLLLVPVSEAVSDDVDDDVGGDEL